METARPPDPALEYVGFWIRVVASLIDSALLMLVVTAAGFVIAFGSSGYDPSTGRFDPIDFLISTVLPAIIVITLWSRLRSTPGKLIFHARIVDAKTGGEPGTGQWVLRYLGYYVSTFGLLIGFVWVAFDPRKQGWHDKMAGTVVVRERHRERLGDADPAARSSIP